MSKRPRIIKTTARAASGGVIVIAALLALLFFRGPGLGQGEGEADSSPLATTDPPDSSSTDATHTSLTSAPADIDDHGGLTPDEEKALSEKILAILIDEHEYRLEIPNDDETIYKTVDLQRLLELAQLAEGDSNGIRVRILRRENARASAEEKLKLELQHVGIRSDAVYMPDEFVP